MDSPSWQLYLGVLTAVVINSWITRHFFRRMPDQILLGSVAIFFLVQTASLLVYLVLTGSALILIGPEVTPNLNHTPFRATLGQTIMPLTALVIGKIFCRRRTILSAGLLMQVNSRRLFSFELILWAFSVGLILYFVGTIFVKVPYLSAAIVYVHLSFYMAPLLIGLCWKQYRRPAIGFLCVALIGGTFALAAGSRSLLFLPLAFFLAGVWFTLSRQSKIWSAVVGITLLTPVFHLSSLIEKVRKEGQTDAERAVLSRTLEVARLAQQARSTETVADTLARGVGRMIMWSNVVALNYCPEVVPYRRFDDFWEELVFLNRSTVSRTPDDYLDESLQYNFGIGGAKLLGFSISVGGSVPFPIVADGWLRGGFAGVLLFSGLMCALWGGAEKVIRHVYAGTPHCAMAFLIVLLSSSYERMGVYGFIYNLRYFAMQLTLWGSLFFILQHLVQANRTTQYAGRRSLAIRAAGPAREDRL